MNLPAPPRHYYGPLIGLICLLAVLALAIWGLMSTDEPTRERYADMSDAERLEAAIDFYDSRPYYERPFLHTEVPEGLPDMRAATCGQCHAAIHEEWSISTHRRAWTQDPQFMEELAKARGDLYDDQDDDYSWMCLNCHTPMIPQLERLVVDLEDGDIGQPIYVDNPIFDPEMQDEAIGCASCHVQDGTVYGPRGDTDAPHATAQGDHLRDEQNCVRCHQAEAIFPDQNLGCFFTTGDEWARSPAAAQELYCQDCHMPPTTRPLAQGYDTPERETRHHWFGGSLIPKQPQYEAQLEPLKAIFGSGATLSLELPKSADCPWADNPERECGELALRIHNKYAGHRFPTGDPERHVEVRAQVYGPDEQRLSEVSQTIGSRYQWYPTIELLSDNRIEAGDSMYLAVDWPDIDQPVTVEIEAKKFRMYEDDFHYHELEGRYVRGRRFHRSRWQVDPDRRSATLEFIDDDLGRRQSLHPETRPPSNR